MSRKEFDALSQDDRVARLARLARSALARWGLESAELELLKYRENAVFEVSDPRSQARYVLRVHRADYHSDAELRSELQWMAALNEAQIEAPRVVPTQSLELFVIASHDDVPEPRQCDLLRWTEGTIIGDIEGGQCLDDGQVRSSHFLAGSLAARIHDHGEHWERPAGFTRPHMDFEGLVGERAYLGPYGACKLVTARDLEILDRARDALRETLLDFGGTPDRYGLTHGDFLPENLLRDGDVVRIIDFDDCGFGWHVMDVATSLMFMLGEKQYDAAFAGFVSGYRSVRSLPDEHLAVLPAFYLARAMTYIGWCGSRPETPIAQEKGAWLVESTVTMAEEFLSQVT